jgi:putative redox protein
MKDTRVSIKWTGKRQFIGTDSGKHTVVMSSHDEDNHTGVKPSDMLLLALGACSAYDVITILEKKRYQLDGFDIVVKSSQDDDPPWTFRRILLEFRFKARGLKEKDARQAVDLSLEKYCSVAATVSGRADISYNIHIIEDEG